MAWISGRRPEKQMHVSALIVVVVTGCRATGLKTTNQIKNVETMKSIISKI
jgi:hypothetical protein